MTKKVLAMEMEIEAILSAGTQQEFFFAGIDGVKFRRPFVPGDQLVMKVVLTKMNKRFGIAKMKVLRRREPAWPSSPSPSAQFFI